MDSSQVERVGIVLAAGPSQDDSEELEEMVEFADPSNVVAIEEQEDCEEEDDEEEEEDIEDEEENLTLDDLPVHFQKVKRLFICIIMTFPILLSCDLLTLNHVAPGQQSNSSCQVTFVRNCTFFIVFCNFEVLFSSVFSFCANLFNR